MLKWLILFIVLIFNSLVYSQDFKTIGYLPYYRFSLIDQIQLDKITHLNISFANPDPLGYLSVGDQDLAPIVKKAQKMDLEVFVSLAGGAVPLPTADNWANLTQPQNRSAFIHKIIEFSLHNELQGIDVDLEWKLVDENYSGFVLELRDSLNSYGLKMTVALPGKYRYPEVSDAALSAFDWINMMVYDLTGPWDPLNPGPHSPYVFAVDAINYWQNQGLEKERLTLGVPFYGWDFTNLSHIKALTFDQIVTLDVDNATKDRTGEIYYNGSLTIADKTELALQELSGIMIWELGQDHFGAYSLLDVVYELINPLVSHQAVLPEQSVKVFPNPFSNQLQIQFQSESNTSVQLTDLTGRVIQQQKMDNQKGFVFNTTDLSSGFYILRLETERNILSKKLIKR